MKRVLSMLLAVCLVLCAVVPAGALTVADFTDIPSDWSRPAIDYCLREGLLNGEGKGKFNPNGKVIRAQIAQGLYNRENRPGIEGLANPFRDVSTQWFAKAVVWCKANDIVNGTSSATFSPTRQVARQDICVMVYNYYTKYLKKAPEFTDESVMARTFTDWSKVENYAKEAVRWANKVGFMKGTSSTMLDPLGKATRAQLAQFLMNLDTVLEKGDTDPTSEPTPTVKPSADPTNPPAGVFPLAMKKPLSIVSGPKQTLAISQDGTVKAAGLNELGGLNVGAWTDIVDLSSTRNQTLGVKSDGTVIGAGHYYETSWKQYLDPLRDVVDIVECPDAINAFFAALHSDGTVTFINKYGESQKLDWTNMVQICAGRGYLVGLRRDGTVAAYGMDYFRRGCMDVEDWTGITFIETGMYNTFGVKADGTVVMVGEKSAGKGNVGDWTDIVAVASGASYTVGLRKDGTVVGVGLNGYGQISVEDWRDIVAVSAGNNSTHTVALRKDGTVLAVGSNGDGQCDVDGWTGIKLK